MNLIYLGAYTVESLVLLSFGDQIIVTSRRLLFYFLFLDLRAISVNRTDTVRNMYILLDRSFAFVLLGIALLRKAGCLLVIVLAKVADVDL